MMGCCPYWFLEGTVHDIMKKQNLAIIYILLLFVSAAILPVGPDGGAPVAEAQIIPDEAIRLRILANSDSDPDQALKRKVRDAVKDEIDSWVQDLTSIEAARSLIQSRLGEIEKIVARVLEQEGSDQTYKVGYGNVEFPTKLYGNYLYPAGQYEAILVTLGEGQGANWWCVLFPPLCFLDFSNGEAVDKKKEEKQAAVQAKNPEGESKELVVEDEGEDVEVKFFLVEWLSKIFA